MSYVLIAGFGRVGLTLATALAPMKHYRVGGLSRTGQGAPGIAEGIQADLSRPQTLRQLPACDYLVFAAAAGERGEAAYRRTYVEGAGNLLAALPRPPKRTLFVSSTAVYGQTDGQWVDETSQTQPAAYNGSVMLEAEQQVLAGDCPATVVRSAGIYGPGREWLINRVRSGGAFQQQPDYYTNRIHQQDLGRVLAHLVERDRQGLPMSDCYLAVDSDPAPEWQVGGFIADKLGLPQPRPAETLKGQNKRCSNQRLLQTGFVFDYPSYRQGYGQILNAG